MEWCSETRAQLWSGGSEEDRQDVEEETFLVHCPPVTFDPTMCPTIMVQGEKLWQTFAKESGDLRHLGLDGVGD